MSDLREKIARAVRQAVMEMAAVGEAPFSERMAAYTEAVNYSADAILALIAPSPDTASTSLVLGGNGSYSASGEAAADAATEEEPHAANAEIVMEIRLAASRVTGGNCAFADDDIVILEHLAGRAVEAGLTDQLAFDVKRHAEAPHDLKWTAKPRRSLREIALGPPLSDGALPRHGKPLSDAMSAHPLTLNREVVARLIEPAAWEFDDDFRANPPSPTDHDDPRLFDVTRLEAKQQTSLVRADAILNLFSTATEPPPLPTGCAEGWRMVPVEPTEEMWLEGLECIKDGLAINDDAERSVRHAYRAMIQAAPQPPAAEGWRPIETAPRDGTPILTYCGSLATPKNSNTMAVNSFGVGAERMWWGRCPNGIVMTHPTHWRPLPAAPQPPQDAGG